MKKFFTYLFIFFGVLFLVELILLAYLYFADPFGIRPLINAFSRQDSEQTRVDNNDNHPALNEDQEDLLEDAGINPATLPTDITPEMEECFYNQLGRDRAMEIVNGDTPSLTEIMKAKNCIE